MTRLEQPAGFLARHIAVSNEESKEFAELNKKMGLIPFWAEYLGDKYVTASERKTGYLKPKDQRGHRKRLVKNLNLVHGKNLNEIKIDGSDQLMVDWHHERWQEKIASVYTNAIREDFTTWLKSFGGAKEYYFAEMTLYLGHGILFKDFHSGINSQSFKSGFTDNIVMPAIAKVEDVFGEKPMVYRFKQKPYFPYLLDTYWH